MNPMGNCFLKKRTPGLGKRGPPTELSREDVEKGNDITTTIPSSIPGDRICTPDEIKQRKILKIKRKGGSNQEKILKPVENTNRGLTLDTELPKGNEDGGSFFGNSINEGGQTSGLFSNNKQDDGPKGWVPQATKASEQPSDVDNGGSSFFGNGKKETEVQNIDVNFKQDHSSLFASNVQAQKTTENLAKESQVKKTEPKKVPAQTTGSLFQTTTGGLFGEGEVKVDGLFKTDNDDEVPQTGGLFSNTDTSEGFFKNENDDEHEEVEEKVEKPKQKRGLFDTDETENEKQSGGFFDSISNNEGGLFGKSNTSGGGLFGKSSSGGGGLFGNQDEEDNGDQTSEKEGEENGGFGFFGNDENDDNEGGGGLFGGLQSSGGGLFDGLVDKDVSNNTKGLDIFSASVKSTGLFAQKEETAEVADPVDKEVKINKAYVQIEIDPTKEFKYEEVTSTLFSATVSNFKVNKIPGYGTGTVAIEKFNDNGMICLIFRNPAQSILSNTIIYKGLSAKGYMKGKTDAVYVYTFQQGEGGVERCQCKMAFTEGEGKAAEFLKIVEGLIKKE